MSDQDEALLDEDFGDEEYDLGNDEEEALLADDNDFERLPEQQTLSKGEEETDDILDLGVTDALDDLETEEENIPSKNSHEKSKQNELHTNKKVDNLPIQKEKYVIYKESQEHSTTEESEVLIKQPKTTDLREKLKEKSNNQRECLGNIQATEDDDFEETREKRNRFQTERVLIPTKMNHDIPDSLENVVTPEKHRPYYRNRERGERNDRCDRGEKSDRGDRSDKSDWRNLRGRSGGRYDSHQSGRYGRGLPPSNQQSSFRAPLLENRISFPQGPCNSTSLTQHHQMYLQHNSQASYHHPLPNGPPVPPGHPHYVDTPLPMAPNQFSEPGMISTQGPRLNAPRVDYGPRCPLRHPPGPTNVSIHPAVPAGPLGHPPRPSAPPGIAGSLGPGPGFNCTPNQPPFLPNQGMFSNHSVHIPERGTHLGNSGPPLSMMSNSAGIHVSNKQMSIVPVSQAVPTSTFVPNTPTALQGLPNAPSQSVFENARIPFTETPPYDGHSQFDSRSTYVNPQVNQFNNSMPQMSQSLTHTNTSQQILVGLSNVQGVANIPNVSVIPTGHKILINPHFRGNQTKCDATQAATDKFVQALRSASNSSLHEIRCSNQQVKSDDPYSYFSDVWQENKSQRSQNINSRRSYSPDDGYSKNSNYNSHENKYKSESQWSHRDGYSEKQEHRNYRDSYREKELSPRPRSDAKHRMSPSNNSYRVDNFDHSTSKISNQKSDNSKSANILNKELNKTATKRVVDDNSDRNSNEINSKRPKSNLRHTDNSEKLTESQSKKDEEEMDPEMKEYRRKMEEQKQLREKILREKENRRKLAALQKQNSKTVDELSKIENVKPETTIAALAKENSKIKLNLVSAKGRSRLLNVQSIEEKPVRVVRAISMKQSKDQLKKVNSDEEFNEDDNEDNDIKRKNALLSQIILNKTKTVQKSLQKNVQKTTNIKGPNANRQLGQIRQLLTNSQRIVLSNSASSPQHIQSTSQESQQQQRQRIIAHKAVAQETKKLIKTNVVKIDNLAASTTESQIRRMCQGIGSIESIQMGDRNATIVFKTQSAAMVFHKKYQRKMLDLSLIKVQLIPHSNVTKVSTMLLKNSTKE